jgi:hypothetical protein
MAPLLHCALPVELTPSVSDERRFGLKYVELKSLPLLRVSCFDTATCLHFQLLSVD